MSQCLITFFQLCIYFVLPDYLDIITRYIDKIFLSNDNKKEFESIVRLLEIGKPKT